MIGWMCIAAFALAEDGTDAAAAVGPSASVEAAPSPEGTVALGGNTYVIQSGDTLWDISTRFLGDAQAWPQLWSVNTYITNPHWIYPGNVIRFQLGDALNPPAVGMTEEPGPVAQAEPTKDWTGVACGFPARFTSNLPGRHLTAPGVIGDAASLNLRGKVEGATVAGSNVGEGQYVYVEMDGAPSLECGEPLAIYRRQGKRLKTERGALGHVYRVLAVGTVVRVDDKMVTLRLRDSYYEVRRGDVVGDSVPVDMRVDITAPGIDGLEAKVLARLSEPEQVLANIGETVCLDRGSDDGVDVGASLFVVERRDGLSMIAPEDKRLPEQVVGRVVIVRSEPAFATGVVVDAARDVQVGARVTTRPNGE